MMLNLSKKVEYGLMALSHMATKGNGDPIPARTIASECAIPPELLGKVLQALTRAGLVLAAPGARGGYRLGKPLDQLSLGAVIEAVEGPVRVIRCADGPRKCEQFSRCTIRRPVSGIRAELIRFVHGITLAALKQAAPGQGENELKEQCA